MTSAVDHIAAVPLLNVMVVDSGLGSFDFDFLVLKSDVTLCHRSGAGSVVGEAEETKTSALPLLLIIHYHNFADLAELREKASQIRLCNAGWQSSKEDLVK